MIYTSFEKLDQVRRGQAHYWFNDYVRLGLTQIPNEGTPLATSAPQTYLARAPILVQAADRPQHGFSLPSCNPMMADRSGPSDSRSLARKRAIAPT